MATPAATAPAEFTPATSAASVRGRFLWHDLMVPDVDAAVRFYGAVAGWTVVPFGEPEPGKPPYLMWMAGGQPVGGVTVRQDDPAAPSAYWLAHVGTPDLDATYAAALGLGARSHAPPTPIPEVGRFAVVADPQGAAFSMYEPADASPLHGRPDVMPAVGGFSWHELATRDAGAAFEFYAALFGWARTGEFDMGPMGVYQMYGQNGRTYGGMFDPGAEVPPAWLLYVRVDSAARAVEAVRANGGTVVMGPTEVPGGDLVAQCRDPQGAAFAVHEARSGA